RARRGADDARRPVPQRNQDAQPRGAGVNGPRRGDGAAAQGRPRARHRPRRRPPRRHDPRPLTPTPLPSGERGPREAPLPCGVRGYRFVNGNEIAALLTHFKLSKLSQQGRLPPSPIVVTTLVTTSQITRIARHFKAQIVDNLLVGFKYHADVLWHLERDGAYEDVRGTPDDFVIATEESHGIMATPQLRDKDAGAAALLMAELALDQKRRNQTTLDYLDRLAREFGYFRNEGIPVFMTGVQGKQQMARMLDRLRESPPKLLG